MPSDNQRCPGPRQLGIVNTHTHARAAANPSARVGRRFHSSSFIPQKGQVPCAPGASMRDPRGLHGANRTTTRHQPPTATGRLHRHTQHKRSRTSPPSPASPTLIPRARVTAFPAPHCLAACSPGSLPPPHRAVQTCLAWLAAPRLARGRLAEAPATPQSRRLRRLVGRGEGPGAGRKRRGAKVQASRGSAAPCSPPRPGLTVTAPVPGFLPSTAASAPETHPPPALPRGTAARLELGFWGRVGARAPRNSEADATYLPRAAPGNFPEVCRGWG